MQLRVLLNADKKDVAYEALLKINPNLINDIVELNLEKGIQFIIDNWDNYTVTFDQLLISEYIRTSKIEDIKQNWKDFNNTMQCLIIDVYESNKDIESISEILSIIDFKELPVNPGIIYTMDNYFLKQLTILIDSKVEKLNMVSNPSNIDDSNVEEIIFAEKFVKLFFNNFSNLMIEESCNELAENFISDELPFYYEILNEYRDYLTNEVMLKQLDEYNKSAEEARITEEARVAEEARIANEILDDIFSSKIINSLEYYWNKFSDTKKTIYIQKFISNRKNLDEDTQGKFLAGVISAGDIDNL